MPTVRRDGEVWVVGRHLEGDFPAGPRTQIWFALSGGRIARLDIFLG